ncbi:chain length determinant protein [Pontibacter sp. H249]|uniref:chain length determinant protein n=1 Tax=Pontibacter sp. H249 TaxID=3133420 RepID=UPI0030BED8F1
MYENKQQEKREKNNIQHDEIDLYFIYNKINLFANRIGQKISYFFKLLFIYKWLLILFVLIGGALGYLAFYVTKPYYSSTMTLMLSNIRNEFIEDQLSKLTDMVKEDNFEEIANRLDINLEAAKQIKALNFSNLDEDRIEEDSILVGSPFKIELLLYDRKLFNSMEPAITNYLENNRYFAKQKRIRQKQLESLINKLESEISSIDSIKTEIGSPRGPVNGFVYGQPIDPTNLYRESVNMYKEQVSLSANLDRLENVEVITGFAPRLYPSGPNLIKYILIGAIVSFLFGVIVVLNKARPTK